MIHLNVAFQMAIVPGRWTWTPKLYTARLVIRDDMTRYCMHEKTKCIPARKWEIDRIYHYDLKILSCYFSLVL
jgi:hypothetical protein